MLRPLLKYTATRWWLWRHQARPGVGPIHFRSALSSVRRVLVHFPPDVSRETVRYVYEKITDFFPDCTIDYLIARSFPDDQQRFLKTTGHSEDVIIADATNRRWLPFLSHDQIGRIREKAFDLVIDFGPRFDITLAHALHASGASIIAGYSAGHGSSNLHNLQVRVQNPDQFPAKLFDVLSRLRS